MTKRTLMRSQLLVLASTLCASILLPGTLQAQRNYYIATEIGGFGGRTTYAYGMNNRGDVVGVATTPVAESSQAFLYRNGSTSHLGTLYGRRESMAMAINDAGAIVGRCGVPFLYEEGVMQDITLYLGGESGQAIAINSKGGVLGAVNSTSSGLVAFYYDSHGIVPIVWMFQPSGPANWTLNEVMDMNDSGMIIGSAGSSDGSHGFLLNGTNVTDLGVYAIPRAINNLGDVVGNWNGSIMVWSGTNSQNLPIWNATPRDINDSGQIVGTEYAGGSQRPFLYDLDTKFVLESLILGTNLTGVTLIDVNCINNNRQIAVVGTSGYNNTLKYRSFLLTPVPIIRNATNSSASTMNLTFWSMTNHTYTVQSSAEPSVWKDLTNVAGIAGDLTIPVATTNGPQRFYRLRMD